MKVSVTLQVEVDPAEWNATYGLGLGHREVAQDIREYVYDAACQRGGVKGTVTLSRSALREVVRGMTEEGII